MRNCSFAVTARIFPRKTDKISKNVLRNKVFTCCNVIEKYIHIIYTTSQNKKNQHSKIFVMHNALKDHISRALPGANIQGDGGWLLLVITVESFQC